MAQVVECLICKCKALNSNPSRTKTISKQKKPPKQGDGVAQAVEHLPSKYKSPEFKAQY
jgi:hypothetical protein